MKITGKARKAGVMGWPVGHSRSPLLHNFWLDRYGIDGVYMPIGVEPGEFEAALNSLPRLGFAGVNVTVPHKEAAFRAVDRTDDVARRIGAVNTIVIGDGLTGSNTDAFGFTESLRACAPEWRADGGPVVVLGAGGAARAILVALQDLGVGEIRLANRTDGRARAVAYAAAKGGVANLTRSIAFQLAPHGIRVNAVSPNKTGSPVGRQDVDPNRPITNLADRPGEPIDTAQAVLFLVSDDSSFVYGQDLFVDGGVMAMEVG